MKLRNLMGWCAVAFWSLTGPRTGAAMPALEEFPAQTTWLLHADLNAMRQTQLGQDLVRFISRPEVQPQWTVFQALFNFDPRTDLHSVTLYGRGPAHDDAVLVVRGTFDTNRLVMLAKSAQEYQCQTHRDYAIHSYFEKQKPIVNGVKPRTYAAIHGTQTVIFGAKPEKVAQALDVLDKKEACMASSPWNKGHALSASSIYLTGWATQFDTSMLHPQAEVLRQAKSMLIFAGESETNTVMEVSLEARDESVARNIQAVGCGLAAIMALQIDNPMAMALAPGLIFQQNGNQVSGSLKIPSRNVFEMIRKQSEKNHPPVTTTADKPK